VGGDDKEWVRLKGVKTNQIRAGSVNFNVVLMKPFQRKLEK